MKEAARRLTSHTDATVFVKIDSTLRGPIEALIAGALEGTGRSAAVFAPAFPEQGRVLRGGRVYVNGKPGAELAEAPGVVIVDAETTADLRALAVAAREHAEWLLVGSAGLARQLAGAIVPPRITAAEGPLLVVAGSPAAATREQLTHLSGREDIIVMSTPHTEERDSGEAATSRSCC